MGISRNMNRGGRRDRNDGSGGRNGRDGGNSRNRRGKYTWWDEMWSTQWEAFIMFLLFELYNIVMVIGSPVIWPAYLIFIIISLGDTATYWESRNKYTKLFSHVPD